MLEYYMLCQWLYVIWEFMYIVCILSEIIKHMTELFRRHATDSLQKERYGLT